METQLVERRVRLPANTVSVTLQPDASGMAEVVIRYRAVPRRARRPQLRLLRGGSEESGSSTPVGDLHL